MSHQGCCGVGFLPILVATSLHPHAQGCITTPEVPQSSNYHTAISSDCEDLCSGEAHWPHAAATTLTSRVCTAVNFLHWKENQLSHGQDSFQNGN